LEEARARDAVVAGMRDEKREEGDVNWARWRGQVLIWCIIKVVMKVAVTVLLF